MIFRLMSECNSFYAAIGLPYDQLSTSGDDLQFSLEGAKAFSRQYLQGKNNTDQNSSYTKRLLSIMNTTNYKQNVQAALAQRGFVPINSTTNTRQMLVDFFGKRSKVVKEWDNKFAQWTGQLSNADIEDILSSMFKGNDRKRGSLIFNTTRKDTTVIKNWDKLSSSIGVSSSLSLFNKENTNQIRSYFREYLFRVANQNKLGKNSGMVDILWDELIKIDNSFLNIPNFKTVFYDHFNAALGNYLNVNMQTDDMQYSNFSLEYIMSLGLDLDLKKIEKNISVLNTNLHTNFLGQQDDHIQIEINGKTYVFQAKNNYSTAIFNSVNLQEEIGLETFSNEVFNQDQAKIFEYLVLNRAFLSKYPLTVKKDGIHDEPFRNKEHSEVENYTQYFLNLTLAYLLAGKISDAYLPEADLQTQNIFFIFKGKYLIPTYLFLVRALELILILENSLKHLNSEPQLQTIGKLQFNKNLIGIHNDKDLWTRKMKALQSVKDEAKLPEDNRSSYYHYTYPDPLVKVGQEFGSNLLQTAKFKKISFRMNVSRLEKYLMK